MAGADAEDGPAIREAIEGSDCGRADGGMAAEQISDTDRHARAAAASRDDGRRHPRVHGVSRCVGNADHGIAVAVGALGEPLAEFGAVGPEEETNLHIMVKLPLLGFRLKAERVFIAKEADMIHLRHTAERASLGFDGTVCEGNGETHYQSPYTSQCERPPKAVAVIPSRSHPPAAARPAPSGVGYCVIGRYGRETLRFHHAAAGDDR